MVILSRDPKFLSEKGLHKKKWLWKSQIDFCKCFQEVRRRKKGTTLQEKCSENLSKINHNYDCHEQEDSIDSEGKAKGRAVCHGKGLNNGDKM